MSELAEKTWCATIEYYEANKSVVDGIALAMAISGSRNGGKPTMSDLRKITRHDFALETVAYFALVSMNQCRESLETRNQARKDAPTATDGLT